MAVEISDVPKDLKCILCDITFEEYNGIFSIYKCTSCESDTVYCGACIAKPMQRLLGPNIIKCFSCKKFFKPKEVDHLQKPNGNKDISEFIDSFNSFLTLGTEANNNKTVNNSLFNKEVQKLRNPVNDYSLLGAKTKNPYLRTSSAIRSKALNSSSDIACGFKKSFKSKNALLSKSKNTPLSLNRSFINQAFKTERKSEETKTMSNIFSNVDVNLFTNNDVNSTFGQSSIFNSNNKQFNCNIFG